MMADGQYPVGQITAVDVATGNTVWQYQQHPYNYSAVLATAGSLVFNGDAARDSVSDASGEALMAPA